MGEGEVLEREGGWGRSVNINILYLFISNSSASSLSSCYLFFLEDRQRRKYEMAEGGKPPGERHRYGNFMLSVLTLEEVLLSSFVVGTASVASVFIAQPFDTVKTVMQTQVRTLLILSLLSSHILRYSFVYYIADPPFTAKGRRYV